MKRRLAFGIAVLALVFCALPTLAAPADPAADDALAAIFAPAPAPDLGVVPQPQNEASRITPKSSCTATCWNGTSLTCSGTTCSATNSNCAAGVRGSCTGSTSGTKTCPACCSATATCTGASVSCSGTSDCFAINKCYASCDGVIHWCGSHGICPI